MKKISYLGPKGTYSEQATNLLVRKMNCDTELIGLSSLEAVAKSVNIGEADRCVMAYYNYLEGLVQECLDLIYENNLYMVGAQRLPIVLSIGTYKGNANQNQIFSHPKALAQCSDWLWENYRSNKQVPTSSTATAAQKVKETKSGLAIASSNVLSSNGLEIIAEDISNKKHGKTNFTDFYLVAKEIGQEYKQRKKYNTMVAITPHLDKPGLLAEILYQVAYYGLNNAKIYSRPALDEVKIGELEPQMFYLEIMDHQNSNDFRRCIDSLRYKLTPKGRDVEVVRVLGSYERPRP